MEKVINLYKSRGKTPLETIEDFRAAYKEYNNEKITYAGRLDPMAEGVLLALLGEETKNREAYTSLDKEYVFEWIFGLSTDTYDLLGLVKESSETGFDFLRNASALTCRSDAAGSVLENQNQFPKILKEFFAEQKGKFIQKYPPFSSKVVNGKSLFSLAKGGRIKTEDLPSHEVEIKESEYLGNTILKKSDLENFIKKTVSSVSGDFRQKQILTDWKNRLGKSDREEYIVHKARLVVGSGFYVRQFVYDIGRKFNTGAVTFSILRTRVGIYKIEKSLHLQ